MAAERVRVVIADDLKLQREMMKAAFASSDRFVLVGEAETGAELVQIAKREQPDLVLTDLNMPVLDGAQALRVLSFSIPACVFIVFSGEEDIEKLRPVISAGASDFLRKPLQMNKLLGSVEAIYEREAPRKRALHASSSPSKGATIVSVVSPQAGCGASTFAANLAVAMANLDGRKVALLDLDFQTAGVTSLMGLSGSEGILEFLQQAEQVDRDLLLKYTAVKHGVRVLPGAPFPLDQARRDCAVLTAMLDVMDSEVDTIVLDLEPRMDEANQVLIGRSDRVYLVVANDPDSLRAGGRWTAVYNHSSPPEGKLRMIYNNARSLGNIPGRDVAEAVGLGISGEVPHDAVNAMVAYREGRPAILDGDSALGKGLRGVVARLADKGI